jgi:hypothetical protein
MARSTLARPLLGALDNVVRAKRKCNAALSVRRIVPFRAMIA